MTALDSYDEKVAELRGLFAQAQEERRRIKHKKYMLSQAKKNRSKAKRKAQRQNKKNGRS